MKEVRFTPDQLAAIAVTERRLDTCVVAGPGSGKTTVLVEYFRRWWPRSRPFTHSGHHVHRKGGRQHAQELAKAFAGHAG